MKKTKQINLAYWQLTTGRFLQLFTAYTPLLASEVFYKIVVGLFQMVSHGLFRTFRIARFNVVN